MKLALIGYGHVARGFLNLLRARGPELARAHGFSPQLVAICARRGGLADPAGLEISGELTLAAPLTFEAAIEAAEVVIELTPTDAQTGGVGLAHCRTALAAGKHLVTANKGPVVVAYRELAALAKANHAQFRFEGTVMGGTPALVLGLETLAAAGVNSVRGIVNGTTNYILTQMEAGGAYADALRRAQELGYAEADPAGDVEGWDAAAKAAILANTLLGGDLRVNDVDRVGITGLTAEMVAAAKTAGERWKLIAQAARVGDRVTASVRPTRLPLTDPLALVGGGMNALTYSTQAIGEVTLFGAGAGGQATGFAVLTDLLRIHQTC